MTDSPIVEELEPEDAFGILSDETRIEILRTLREADGRAVSFSKLRDAVGIRDSGKFNYHLGQLTGRFVDKTGGGYELRPAGQHVVGSLLAGGYTMTADVDPIVLEDSCSVCDSDLVFTYVDGRVRIDCRGCSHRNAFPVPPGAFADFSIERFPSVANRYVKTLLTHARNEFCSACEGRVRTELTTFGALDSDYSPPEFDDAVAVVYDCDRCGMSTQISLSTVLLDHPRVSAFHYEHGIDSRNIPIWQLGAADGDPQSTMLEDETGAARVHYAVGEHRLAVTVDESLVVVTIERL